MEKEKTVDELLDELGWGWLPFTVGGMIFFVTAILPGWLG
jgi:hypothetical protein